MNDRTGAARRLLRDRGPLIGAGLALLVAIIGVVPFLIGSGGTAAAAAQIDSSEPADGSTVRESPEELVLNFTRPLGSTNQVLVSCNSNPAQRAIGRPELSDDERSLTVEVVRALPMGTCTASWNVSEPDGTPGGTGSFTFEIETEAQTPETSAGTDGETDDTTPATSSATTAGTAADGGGSDEGGSSDVTVAAIGSSGGSEWGLWLGRMLSIGGIAVVFGALVLIAVAWPEGPEYIIAVRFVRAAWLIGLIGTILYVVAARASATGESLAASLNPVDWSDLLDAGWPGRAALARLLLVVAAGWVAFLPERAVESTTQLVGLGIPALAVATIGLTRTDGDLAALGIAMAIIHALAMAVWIGGALFVSRIVLAGSGDEDLVHAVRGFSRLSMPAVVITVITGLVQLVRLAGGDLFTSGYGRVLLGKVAVVAIAVFVTVAARQAVVMRFSRARELEAAPAGRLRRAFGTDAVLGLGALALTGWMLTYPPGNVDSGDDTSDYPISEQVSDPETGVDIGVSLRPGRVGANELRVEVRAPADGVRGLEVTFIPPEGSSSPQVTQSIPLDGRGVAVSAPGDGIPLGEAGTWRLLINASTSEGNISGGQNTFDVRREDGSLDESVVDPDGTDATTGGSSDATTSDTGDG